MAVTIVRILNQGIRQMIEATTSTASESIGVTIPLPNDGFACLVKIANDTPFLQIESIKMERSQTGFSKRYVVVSVKIDGKWFEVIRDLETSSNSHEVTADKIREFT